MALNTLTSNTSVDPVERVYEIVRLRQLIEDVEDELQCAKNACCQDSIDDCNFALVVARNSLAKLKSE